MTSTETLLACLTPPGSGAIATLALWGPNAWNLVREYFRPLKDGKATPLPDQPIPERLWLGRLGGEVADQVVVAARLVREQPWVEVHCHGGREVTRELQQLFQTRGVRGCTWQELERLSDPNPIRAAARIALTEARTVRTAAILLDQANGAFENAMTALRLAEEKNDHAECTRLLGELASRAPLGRHLTTPWRVVVAGAPNVGKSSLVNALAGYQRCIVSPTPGTTRDLVTTVIALDGWPIELVDTAGLRDDAANLEAQGIELARDAAHDADLCLWVVDTVAAPPPPPRSRERLIPIINKIDLPPTWNLAELGDAARVSALTGEGLGTLCQQIVTRLVPAPPPPGAAVPFTAELCDRVEQAWNCWNAGRETEAFRLAAQED